MKKLLAVVFIFSLCAQSFANSQSKKYEKMNKGYCTSGESGQETSACLEEIRSLKSEKYSQIKKHDYNKNIMRRCADFSDFDKFLCEDRLMYGEKTGSVKKGGTITQLEEKKAITLIK